MKKEQISLKQIVVIQRGWVVIGDIAPMQDKNFYLISNAAVIRRWGTSKGLGEIAEGGPTKDTVLDPCPNVIVNELSIIMRIMVNEKKW